MKLKKMLSVLCAATMLLALFMTPCVYAESAEGDTPVVNTVSYVNDDFENGDLSDWYFRDDNLDGTKSATVVTEDGNKFLRVSFSGLNPEEDGGMVTYSKKFSDGKFMRDMENYTVIEMKLRTNSSTQMKYIKFNYPTSGEKSVNAYNEIGWNTRLLATLRQGEIQGTYSDNFGAAANVYMQGNREKITNYDLNNWYTIKHVYNNAEGKADTYVYNEAGTLLNSFKNKALSAWWFNYYDYARTIPLTEYTFEDITLQFRSPTRVTDEQLDIDDLRIFNQKEIIEAKVIPNTEEGIIYNPEELELVFDAPVTVAEGGITIVDSQGGTVTHNGSYDENTFTYTASFESTLQEGGYKFIIDSSKVVPVNETSGMIESMSFKATEIPFSSFATMPPVVDNVRITGRVIPDTVISAEYDYISEANEGTSVYEWYMCSSANGEFTKIENEASKEITVTEQMYGNYIKFKVKPITSAGLEGTQYYESNVIVPEKAPVADNITFNTDIFALKSKIIVSYDYTDENGDGDDGTEINWYISDNGTDNWNLAESGNSFYILDEYENKYVKCVVTPVNNALYENTGTPVESNIYGPVKDIVSLTNKLENGDFESGNIIPWVDEGIAIEIAEDAFSGNYSMRTSKRTGNSDNFHQDVVLDANKTYIFSAMIKSATSKSYSGYEGYQWKGTVTKLDRDAEMATVGPQWQRVTLSFSSTNAGTYAFGYMSFAALDAETYVDDVYLGELMISDIETYTTDPVTVPKGTDIVKVPVTSGRIFNQFGETDGLTGQDVVVSVPELTGIDVVDNQVIVGSSANAGIVEITVSCTPTYKGAAQSVYTKTVELEILPHNDTIPKVLNVNASGDVITGGILTGTYDYYQVEGKADASTVKWIYSDSENGTYYDIPGADTSIYTVDEAYKDKFIKFAVTPKASDGTEGTTVLSNVLAKATSPVASDVSIEGDFKIGGTVTGNYSYKDINQDNEGTSLYKWYVSDTSDGTFTEITGQSGKTLILTEEFMNKYIKFSVTPVSVTAPENGAEVISNAYIGPVAPSVSNITLTNSSGRLVANYDYYHPYNARELESLYEWMVDGSVVSTGQASYTINFSGTKTVTFSVTPVGDTNPSTGTKVSKTVIITGSNASTGGSTSGGGGSIGGGFSGGGGSGGSLGGSTGGSTGGYANESTTSGVVSINNMLTSTNENNAADSDIKGHWGEVYIKDMESRGVMKTDDKGNYNPDINVSREEMVTFLFDALKLAESEYSSQFTDVKDGEFANKLQTMIDNGTIAKDISFRPNDTISREEMCKILYVSLKNAGKLAEVEDGLINTFADFDNISEWARVYVNAIYGNKIMVGVSETEFDAKGTVTKAQAATMLVRILKLTEAE